MTCLLRAAVRTFELQVQVKTVLARCDQSARGYSTLTVTLNNEEKSPVTNAGTVGGDIKLLQCVGTDLRASLHHQW